jgi:hypothetical protein
MILKKSIQLIPVFALVFSSVTQAQIASSYEPQTFSSERVEAMRETVREERSLAVMQQLLGKSRELKAQYAQNEVLVDQIQFSLNSEKEKCVEVCTKDDLKKSLTFVQELSVGAVGAAYALNSIRGIVGGFVGSDAQMDRGMETLLRPFKTKTGKAILGGFGLTLVASIAKSYVEIQETYSKNDIEILGRKLVDAKAELQATSFALDANNRAIEQSLRIRESRMIRQ